MGNGNSIRSAGASREWQPRPSNPSWGTGTAWRSGWSAVAELPTPHGERELRPLHIGGPTMGFQPLMGNGNRRYLGLSMVSRILSSNPSWGTGTRSSGRRAGRWQRPSNPSWGTGTCCWATAGLSPDLPTPHGERELPVIPATWEVRGFQPLMGNGNLDVPCRQLPLNRFQPLMGNGNKVYSAARNSRFTALFQPLMGNGNRKYEPLPR